jgi:hypothetical protein
MSFSNMKKAAKDNSSLMEELNKISSGSKKDYNDDRFWKPTRDKSDNGYAVVRFLPPVEGEDVPWIRIFNHGFKGKGGWLIDNCPTTIGKKCPVCEANSALWNTGNESDKDIARNRKRKLQYVSNIMVITDSKNPDAEGKVFLYKFGKKIFDKIQEVLQPEFDDETPMNPFDFWKGADFKIKIRKVGGFVNYDKSEFDSPSEFLDGDDGNLEEVWGKQYKLQEFIQEDQFKSYDELKVRLDTVLGGGGSASGRVAQSAEDIADSDNEAPVSKRPAPSSKTTATVEDSGSGEEDDALSYFEKLANED